MGSKSARICTAPSIVSEVVIFQSCGPPTAVTILSSQGAPILRKSLSLGPKDRLTHLAPHKLLQLRHCQVPLGSLFYGADDSLLLATFLPLGWARAALRILRPAFEFEAFKIVYVHTADIKQPYPCRGD